MKFGRLKLLPLLLSLGTLFSVSHAQTTLAPATSASIEAVQVLMCEQPSPPASSQAAAIEVEMIQAGEISLPGEFQVALYENLVEELQKKGGFSQVYRDGDRHAADASGLVILHTTVTGFKKGSELERDVTTVGGATSIILHCQFTDKEGKVPLERDITGKVRLIGDNLKATDDFAKKATTVAREDFSSDSPSSNSKKSGYKNVI